MQTSAPQVVRVPVDSLEIDLPLDANNVTEKTVSLQASGLIQPLTLWQGPAGRRVIDGFHRIAAAKLLGWTEIDAIVQEVSEEAFWDARIQSARQHASISNDRLAVWVTSCWQSSEWPSKLNLSQWRPGKDDVANGFRFRRKPTQPMTPAHKQVAEALWLLRTDQVQHGDFDRLSAWFSDKATKWSMTIEELETIIYGLVGLPQPNAEFEVVAASKGITFDQRNALANDVVRGPYRAGGGSPTNFKTKNFDTQTAAKYLANAHEGETYQNFLKRELDEASLARRKTFAASASDMVNGHVERIKQVVNNNFEDLRRQGPAGAAALLNASAVILELADKVYPGAKRGDVNIAIAEENLRLSAELAQVRLELAGAKKKLDRLQADLDRRRAVFGKAQSASVYHSAEVEAQ